jgi:hypothetical protein
MQFTLIFLLNFVCYEVHSKKAIMDNSFINFCNRAMYDDFKNNLIICSHDMYFLPPLHNSL